MKLSEKIAIDNSGGVALGFARLNPIPRMNSTRKTVALLSTSALAAGAARGAILYTPLNLTITGDTALTLDLNQDGAPDFQMQFDANGAAKPVIISTNSPNACFVLSASSNQGLPVTTLGTMINGSYQSAQSTGYFNKNSGGTVVGSWTAGGNIDAYVGLELQDGAGTHYAWAHFIYNSSAAAANDVDSGQLTLVDAAMETSPGVGILAGQTAESGSKPVIVTTPSAQTGFLGGSAQLSVVATGNPAPSYQWKSGAVGSGIYSNVTPGPNLTVANVNSDGARNAVTVRDLTPAKMADYVVVVSNSAGSVTNPVPATLTVAAASDTPATLTHRYSFQDQANSPMFADSVGGPDWSGSLEGDATLTGSSLLLDGTVGTFASLPSGMVANYTQITVEFWADIGAQSANWTRVFSFGNQINDSQKQSGFDYCPNAPGGSTGYQNVDYLNNNGQDVYANNSTALTNVVNAHVTVVLDSVNGDIFYYNGTNLVSTLHDNNLSFGQTMLASSSGLPMSMTDVDDTYNVIGASLAAVDPYLNATIHEFRIYQGVLPLPALALNDAVGPANYIELSADPALSASLGGGNLVLSWPAGDVNFAVQSRSGLSSGSSWATLTNVPALVGTNWQVTLPSSGAAKFFQLIHK